MSIDFGVLWRSPGLMAALVLGFLAIKALVIYTLARMIGLPYQDRAVFTMWWRGRATSRTGMSCATAV